MCSKQEKWVRVKIWQSLRQTDAGQTPGSERLLNISHFPNITDLILSCSFSSDFVWVCLLGFIFCFSFAGPLKWKIYNCSCVTYTRIALQLSPVHREQDYTSWEWGRFISMGDTFLPGKVRLLPSWVYVTNVPILYLDRLCARRWTKKQYQIF